ncbi:single-stranded DNA-binding protein [Gangjinia marincola]|uniref:Single-stranded DNA-binding protein n=1 Tax=Gangjinia marincola TaxID=578463 RepID=A0ABN1MHB3_9FLAO
MAGTINKVILIGHTGDDVKMHYFEGGGSLGRFPLATNEEYVNKSTGERVSNTEWHNVVVRNKAAEICEKYLKKGDKIYVEGRIKTRKWQDESGNDRYSTEIHCRDFTFLTPKEDQNVSPQNQQMPVAQPQAKVQENQPVPSVNEDEDDDLPF